MKACRELKDRLAQNRNSILGDFGILWDKLIEMEDRIEKLETRPAPTPYSERRM